MRKKWIWLFSLLAALLFLTGHNVLAAAPKLNASVTEKNVLALMDAYDKDSAYLLRTMARNGDSITSWWQSGEWITDSINTAVHEECHGYTHRSAPWGTEDIYIGSRKYIRVRFTSVFPSKKMSTSIPERLRTFRWSTYVGKPTANLASNVHGVYGLLNEFTAYYWGMHAQMSLYDYYKENGASRDQWMQFINICANDRLAYAEFKYYMMHYLIYAKQHNRATYNGIIRNASYVKAYQTIEKKFSALIAKFEKRMKDIATLLEGCGYEVEMDEYYFVHDEYGVGSGIGIFQKDYDNLIGELAQPSYQNILKGSSSSDAAAVGKTSITSLKKTKKGVQLKWKKASGAKEYYVYRKTSGEKSYKKVKTASGTSWTDKSVKKRKKYSYKIVPFAKKGTKTVKGKASAVKSLQI